MEKRISKPNTLYDSNMLYSIEYGELFIYRNEIVGNKTLRTHVNGCICKEILIMKWQCYCSTNQLNEQENQPIRVFIYCVMHISTA